MKAPLQEDAVHPSREPWDDFGFWSLGGPIILLPDFE